MADKARDLQFRVLSDLSRLNLDDGARQLDELGDTGRRTLDKLDDGIDSAAKSMRDYADDSRDSARRIAKAFDDISDASKKSSKKIDGDLDDAKKGLDDFKEEAHGSGREAAASFGGGFDDITSFVQETAANAFAGFGPIGAAAGVAAALGIGVITKVFQDSKARAEEAKQEISGWVDAFVEGQGKIREATIATKLNEIFGDPDRYKKISTDAREAGVSVELYGRALAGDADAAREVTKRVQGLADAIDGNNHRTTESEAASLRQANALKRVKDELGITTGTISSAESAWRDLDKATRAGITATVKVDAPSPKELDAINKRVRDGIGVIVVDVKPGQSRFANTTNNSRYRY